MPPRLRTARSASKSQQPSRQAAVLEAVIAVPHDSVMPAPRS